MTFYEYRNDVRAPDFVRAAGVYSSVYEIVAVGVNADVDAYNAGTPNPTDVSSSLTSDIYAGFPTSPAMASAETADIVSGSADDDGDPGAGTLYVRGLDENGEYQAQSYTLTGTTEVVSTEQWHRVWDAIVTGGTATNVGAITVAGTTTSANVFATVPAGVGRTQQASFTVPSNGQGGAVRRLGAQVSNVQSGGTAVEAEIALLRRPVGGTWEQMFVMPFSNLHQYTEIPFASGLELAALDDVKLQVIDATADNLHVVGVIQASLF